ncbi:GtrA family protein [Lichenihabitans sp. Uapishka_5]|uniref:GtrA family protein n=1 Tax=Lichenihabitans sp. Uapishka_5 TaxID=3037302 RepID=UPI0029E7E966|nr:GtrA family protein [Lichenihabitans sp. Uapishka_5]MDX7952830.1 GtrA family protein [Lichenihabitans sp. Uapishka_5]
MTSARLRLAAVYAVFAAIAAGLNLGTQWCCVALASRMGVPLSMALWPALVVGTGTGLVVKYGLDKRFIFDDRSKGLKAHGRQFSLYTLMGLTTTAIFWGTEFLFSRLDPSGRLIYLGGAIGLAVGYVVKYELDRRFVFTGRNTAADAR